MEIVVRFTVDDANDYPEGEASRILYQLALDLRGHAFETVVRHGVDFRGKRVGTVEVLHAGAQR